tara:strand:+ start:198 stop:473 length:276 start_codon:yes stop_codon:yes gene_type:complete
MEGSVVLDIEEQETEKKDPIIKEGRITESFEIQMDEIDKEVEKKLEEISKKNCEQCNDSMRDDVTQCLLKFFAFSLMMGILYFIANNIRNN